MSKKKKIKKSKRNMNFVKFSESLFYLVKGFMEQSEITNISLCSTKLYDVVDIDIIVEPFRKELQGNPIYEDIIEGLSLYMQCCSISIMSILNKDNNLYISIDEECSALTMAFNCLSVAAANKILND